MSEPEHIFLPLRPRGPAAWVRLIKQRRPPKRAQVLYTAATLLVASFMVVACASPQTAGPAKAKDLPRDARAYYPLEPGWKWAYDVEQNGEAILATFAVSAREGDKATVLAGDQVLQYVVRPDGILRPSSDRADTKAGDYVLRAPLGAQATWPVEGGQAKVVGWNETVTTPAGQFDGCVTVEERRQDPDRHTRTTYAPGIGPVRIEFQAMDPAGIHHTKAFLRGYTRPGEDPLAESR